MALSILGSIWVWHWLRLIFGTLMDGGRFSHVLISIAVLQTLAIFTALRVGKAV